jgi:hypothetical protein
MTKWVNLRDRMRARTPLKSVWWEGVTTIHGDYYLTCGGRHAAVYVEAIGKWFVTKDKFEKRKWFIRHFEHVELDQFEFYTLLSRGYSAFVVSKLT